MPRGLYTAILISLVSVIALSMGACPRVIPNTDEPVDAPVFQPADSTFSDSLDVSLSCATNGAVIRYTTDGSLPSASHGTVYQGPITLTATTTVLAIATKEGMDPSDVVTATFTLAAQGYSLAISNPAASGSLVQGQSGTISVSCSVTAQGSQVQSVVADLSQVGGPAAQPLDQSGNDWTWSGPVTATTSGTRTVVFIATDDTSATVTATTTISVSVPGNQPPTLSNAIATGHLVRGKPGTVSVACSASDTDGTVQGVDANLSAIGGATAQPLSLIGGTWTWNGTVTPLATGSKTVTFTATDNGGAAAATSTTISVSVPTNESPVLSNCSATGPLVFNKPGSVSVACSASDSDGTVQSVVADLSAIGGQTAQPLASNGGTWTWNGTVTPPAAGLQTVTFTATDNAAATVTATATLSVSVPNNKLPTVSNTSATGQLANGVLRSVTVSCSASDTDGTIQGVVADLHAIGGDISQPLSPSGGAWTWTGPVKPTAEGDKLVTFTATDNGGGTATATAPIHVGAAPSTLEGTWSGDVTYSDSLGTGSPLAFAFVRPSSVTFSADYQPQTLAMFFVPWHRSVSPASQRAAKSRRPADHALHKRGHHDNHYRYGQERLS